MTAGELKQLLNAHGDSDEVIVFIPGLDEGVSIDCLDSDRGIAGLYLKSSAGQVDAGKASALALLGDIERMAQEAASQLSSD